MAKSSDSSTNYRQIEQRVTLTVVSTSPTDEKCQECGKKGLVFHVHLFCEPGRPIADLCKNCAIAQAGGEDKVYVRSGEFLQRRWKKNGRLAAPKIRPSSRPAPINSAAV